MAGLEDARSKEESATVAVRSVVGDLRGVAFGRARRRSFKGVEHLVQVCPVQRSA